MLGTTGNRPDHRFFKRFTRRTKQLCSMFHSKKNQEYQNQRYRTRFSMAAVREEIINGRATSRVGDPQASSGAPRFP